MLAGYIDRLMHKTRVNTTLANPKTAKESAELVVAEYGEVKDDAHENEVIEVTVAPRKTIGRGNTAQGPGCIVKVTRKEARRLKLQGFIV